MTSECLVLMPCSGAKLSHPARADEIYRGVMWQTLRSHIPAVDPPELLILSALYGFVEPARVLHPYDLRLDAARAAQLSDSPAAGGWEAWPSPPSRILLAGGGEYRGLMRKLIGNLQALGKLGRELQVSEVSGGIGCQRAQLGRFLRDPGGLPAPITGYQANGTPLLAELSGFAVGDKAVTRYPGCPGEPATISSLFIGPSGPTADIALDDLRPALASGKQRRAWNRSRWIGLRHLAPSKSTSVASPNTGEQEKKLYFG